MTEGYESRTGSLDDELLGKLPFKVATVDEVLFALEFGMTYQRSNHRGRQAEQIAIKAVAAMAYNHLKESGFIIMKRPPSEGMDLTKYMASRKIPMKD